MESKYPGPATLDDKKPVSDTPTFKVVLKGVAEGYKAAAKSIIHLEGRKSVEGEATDTSGYKNDLGADTSLATYKYGSLSEPLDEASK